MDQKSNKKALFSFISLIILGLMVYLLFNGSSESFKPFTTKEKDQESKVALGESQGSAAPLGHDDIVGKEGGANATKIRFDQGKVIMKTGHGSGEGEIGVTTGEGGGFGPASFFVGEDGKVYVLDRNNSRILAGYGNNLKTIKNLDQQYVKGMTVGEDENLHIVTGNLDLTVESYDKYGEKIEREVPSNFKPDFLNAVDLRNYEDGFLVTSSTKIYQINKEGRVKELSGMPIDKTRAYKGSSFMDASLDNNGQSIALIFRAANDAPVAEKRIQGDFDSIYGMYPVTSGNIVLVAEERIKNGEISALIYTLKPSGAIADVVKIKSDRHFVTDQPYHISADGCKATHIMSQSDRTVVREYALNCRN